MDLGLKNKVALVAASSKGLGKAIARGFAEEGVNLVMCARGEDTLKKATKEIETATGANVLAMAIDVTQQDQVKRLVDQAIARFGRIDILINNAGGPPAGMFLDHSPEVWEKSFQLTFLSTVYMCHAVIPFMQKQRWGRIITITSVSVKQPVDGLVTSNAIRAGVTGLTKTMATELAKDNILINNVCPGYIRTDRFLEVMESRAKKQGISVDEVIASLEKTIPQGRVGEPHEFANMVVFLASERANYITGTSIQIDGGVVKSLL
jgi:3-oxoacyl-[acyl-carrier protein] reductase